MPVQSWFEVARADNPGPLRLEGTNSYVVRTGAGNVIVDPGPDLPAHLEALGDRGEVACIVLTHHHDDHAGGARSLHSSTGAPVRAADPKLCIGGEPLSDTLAVGGREFVVLQTPGHTADSLCLALPEERIVLTGDTVLGRGSSIVAHPDGNLRAYFASLQRLLALTDDGRWVLAPGHGPLRDDAHAIVTEYREHRLSRLEQVRDAVAAGASSPRDVVEVVYADVDRELWPAAEAAVRAQLDYLAIDSDG